MPRLKEAKHNNAISRLQTAVSSMAVSRFVHVTPSPITKYWNRCQTHGSTRDLPRSGRPRITTRAQERFIRLRHLRPRDTHTQPSPFILYLPGSQGLSNTAFTFHSVPSRIPGTLQHSLHLSFCTFQDPRDSPTEPPPFILYLPGSQGLSNTAFTFHSVPSRVPGTLQHSLHLSFCTLLDPRDSPTQPSPFIMYLPGSQRLSNTAFTFHSVPYWIPGTLQHSLHLSYCTFQDPRDSPTQPSPFIMYLPGSQGLSNTAFTFHTVPSRIPETLQHSLHLSLCTFQGPRDSPTQPSPFILYLPGSQGLSNTAFTFHSVPSRVPGSLQQSLHHSSCTFQDPMDTPTQHSPFILYLPRSRGLSNTAFTFHSVPSRIPGTLKTEPPPFILYLPGYKGLSNTTLIYHSVPWGLSNKTPTFPSDKVRTTQGNRPRARSLHPTAPPT
ncbi:uncharacterized protein [Haliotis cracherodii]|uniref:uncharacterized protein n=1 Tax=Haliotis cracherodii TaxID=6455 RepID=UPI0039ECD09D